MASCPSIIAVSWAAIQQLKRRKNSTNTHGWRMCFFSPSRWNPNSDVFGSVWVRRENFEVTLHTRICSNHWVRDGPSVAEPNPTIFPYNKKWRDPPGRSSTESHARKCQQAEQRPTITITHLATDAIVAHPEPDEPVPCRGDEADEAVVDDVIHVANDGVANYEEVSSTYMHYNLWNAIC